MGPEAEEGTGYEDLPRLFSNGKKEVGNGFEVVKNGDTLDLIAMINNSGLFFEIRVVTDQEGKYAHDTMTAEQMDANYALRVIKENYPDEFDKYEELKRLEFGGKYELFDPLNKEHWTLLGNAMGKENEKSFSGAEYLSQAFKYPPINRLKSLLKETEMSATGRSEEEVSNYGHLNSYGSIGSYLPQVISNLKFHGTFITDEIMNGVNSPNAEIHILGGVPLVVVDEQNRATVNDSMYVTANLDKNLWKTLKEQNPDLKNYEKQIKKQMGWGKMVEM